MVPRNLNDSTAVTELFMMVSGGEQGVSPNSQLLNLLSVSRLVTVLNLSGVICKLQELDRGVFRLVVVRVQGEEQWGENTALRSSSADRTGAG